MSAARSLTQTSKSFGQIRIRRHKTCARSSPRLMARRMTSTFRPVIEATSFGESIRSPLTSLCVVVIYKGYEAGRQETVTRPGV